MNVVEIQLKLIGINAEGVGTFAGAIESLNNYFVSAVAGQFYGDLGFSVVDANGFDIYNFIAAGCDECDEVLEGSAFEVDGEGLICTSLEAVFAVEAAVGKAGVAFFEGSALLQEGQGCEFWSIDIFEIQAIICHGCIKTIAFSDCDDKGSFVLGIWNYFVNKVGLYFGLI